MRMMVVGFTFDKTGKPKVSENSTGGQGLRLLQVDAIGLGGSLKIVIIMLINQ